MLDIRQLLKILIHTIVPYTTDHFEEFHLLRKNWRLMLLGIIRPEDVLKSLRKQRKQDHNQYMASVKKKQSDQEKEAVIRRQSIVLDEIEMAKYVIKEELNALVDLNKGELNLVMEIKNMLKADNLDGRVIDEVRSLLDELKDKVGEAGDAMKEKLLKGRLLRAHGADDDSQHSSEMDASQIDTHNDSNSNYNRANSNLKRQNSNINLQNSGANRTNT